ncbi:MAG: pyridoxal phosphate-dependent aminotransferase [Chitinophagales bacterium]|mgnify:FL=1|jgi:aspartate aminotransferase|nr:pyridoxal phosphate-dependent aminotransferase [Bacteroidota bacterium]MBK9554742.1 pyridoxal phosphate-dependent aminotransferase [Bacteroidota bacterium]MBL0281273.1 pyridoxal phosphate-dependent aminotransferase [Bacteroidota bacterium]
MQELAKRIANLNESATIKMAQLTRELKSQGRDIIDLSLGEPDFETPEHIKAAAKKAIDDGFTHYTPVAGYLDVRKAIAEKFMRENGLLYTPEQIVISTGAKQSIINAVLCLVNPGDEVILPTPFWVSYSAMVKLAEGTIVEIPTSIESDFKITPEQLEKAITPKTKLIMFSSPCNPTGTVYTKDELKALAEVVARHENVYIISDEIYEHINFTGQHASMAQFDFIYDRVVTVNGLSKAYAMTGWRLGYIGAPLWIAKACDKIQGQYTSATCSITQRAAIAALEGDVETTLTMKAAFLRRRDLVFQMMQNIKGLKFNNPQGAFYFFPDVSNYFGKTYNGNTINNADDMAMYLLNEGNLSVVTGSAFGDQNCIRFSYATSDDKLVEAMKRLKIALEKLITQEIPVS